MTVVGEIGAPTKIIYLTDASKLRISLESLQLSISKKPCCGDSFDVTGDGFSERSWYHVVTASAKFRGSKSAIPTEISPWLTCFGRFWFSHRCERSLLVCTICVYILSCQFWHSELGYCVNLGLLDMNHGTLWSVRASDRSDYGHFWTLSSWSHHTCDTELNMWLWNWAEHVTVRLNSSNCKTDLSMCFKNMMDGWKQTERWRIKIVR